jgi:dihydropteroate synthase
MAQPHLHFVTGRLAEHALRAEISQLASQIGFAYSVDVLPITVAALMTPTWVARHISIPPVATRVILPGYCEGELAPVASLSSVPVERGPRDLRLLGEYLSGKQQRRPDYGDYDIEIVAEINHAPRMQLAEILQQANALRRDGADVIDVGCDPGDAWLGVSDCVKALRDEGLRVSIDSLNAAEIAPAVRAGAELVLSVNGSNREAAVDWGCEVVVIPDDMRTLAGLEATIDYLANADVRMRIDPVLEPIGCGFADSLERYHRVRRMYPDAEMLMGTGNLTELTDVDSAGVNVLLLGICQELGIRSVLTTQVINWARTSVRECDVARRLVHESIRSRTPPKNIDSRLVMLRDPKLLQFGGDALERLASEIRDNSYRVYVDRDEIHLVGAGLHLQSHDPFILFERLLHPGFGSIDDSRAPANIDPSHAFYLGFEMAKALTAISLGKQYQQDESLNWGLLTRPEVSHRLTKANRRKQADQPSSSVSDLDTNDSGEASP